MQYTKGTPAKKEEVGISAGLQIAWIAAPRLCNWEHTRMDLSTPGERKLTEKCRKEGKAGWLPEHLAPTLLSASPVCRRDAGGC